MDISREDGELFAVTSFTFQLLANTGGAGAALEIMPMLGGEDARPEPYMYQATGFAGMQFTNNTPELSGYDAYKITLYVDYAVMKLTAVDASPPRPALDLVRVNAEIVEISWPTNAVGYALESATNLPTQAWSPVTNTVVVSGEFFSVQIDRGGSKRFFRLRR